MKNTNLLGVVLVLGSLAACGDSSGGGTGGGSTSDSTTTTTTTTTATTGSTTSTGPGPSSSSGEGASSGDGGGGGSTTGDGGGGGTTTSGDGGGGSSSDGGGGTGGVNNIGVEIVPCVAAEIDAELGTSGLTFLPDALTLAPGDILRFTPTGSHSMVSVDGAFETEVAQTQCLLFTVVGIYDYECGIHGSSMNGTITVE